MRRPHHARVARVESGEDLLPLFVEFPPPENCSKTKPASSVKEVVACLQPPCKQVGVAAARRNRHRTDAVDENAKGQEASSSEALRSLLPGTSAVAAGESAQRCGAHSAHSPLLGPEGWDTNTCDSVAQERGRGRWARCGMLSPMLRGSRTNEPPRRLRGSNTNASLTPLFLTRP